MTRTERILKASIGSVRARVMPFVCGGFPSPGTTERIVIALGSLGCPAIEIGIPFSDPIADGPVIAAAMHRVLNPTGAGGTGSTKPATQPATPKRVFEEVARARAHTTAALIAMVSYSIVVKHGEERFVGDAAAAGFDGFIVPDLPLEESDSLRSLASNAGCSLSLLVAPTTPADRAAQIAQACSGFVYLLARTGITGNAAPVSTSGEQRGANRDESLAQRVGMLRAVTSLPIACGFGISTREDVRRVLACADAAIVGSALVRAMDDADARGQDPVVAATAYVRGLIE